MALTRDAFFETRLRTTTLEVPGFDEPIVVRELTDKELREFRRQNKENIETKDGVPTFVGDEDASDMLPWVVLCVVDPETGAPIFKQGDDDELERVRNHANGAFAIRCFAAIMQISRPDLDDLVDKPETDTGGTPGPPD